MDINILEELEKKVQESLNNDEIPIGAVIFDNEGKIIASASNTRQNGNNILGHAEINAIIDAEKAIMDWRLDGYNMIVNLEPCDMCSIIIKKSRLNKVLYFLGNNSNQNIVTINKKEIVGSEYEIYKKKYKKILSTYFKNKR